MDFIKPSNTLTAAQELGLPATSSLATAIKQVETIL